MKKKLLYYILCGIIGFGLSVCIYSFKTTKLISENAKLTNQIEEEKVKNNSLEEQVEEFHKSYKELTSQNTAKQKSLDDANEWNRLLVVQMTNMSILREFTDEHYGNYQGKDDFSDFIKNNPIDKHYLNELNELQVSGNFTTLAMGEFESKYTLIWVEEVNFALSYLYETLNEQDSANLKQAQESWQSFMDDDEYFVSEKFIYTRFFGSQGFVQFERVRLHRTRERAIELMEYIFSIDRDAAEFVYDSKND